MFAPKITTKLNHVRQEGVPYIRSSKVSEEFHVRRVSEHHPIRRTVGSHKASLKAKYAPAQFSSTFGGHRYKTSLVNQPGLNTFRRLYSTGAPAHNQIGLPALSPTMEKGNIAKWRKKEGDKVKPGEVIAEIETDKATVDFESTEEGYIAKILFPEGTKDLSVGQAIAIMVENKEDIAAFKDYKTPGATAPKPVAPSPAPQAAAPSAPAPQAPSQPAAQPAQPAGRVVPGAPPAPSNVLPKSGVKASPLAKATATQEGIEISSVQGSGPGGRVIQADVFRQQQQPARAAPVGVAGAVAGVAYTDIPNSQIRRVIASRLSMSKQTIPHYYLSVDLNVDNLLKLRTQLNEKSKGAYKLSVNDFVVKASALALKQVPEANSSWTDEAIRRYHSVDINVAVNTDRGLMTPLIRDADKIGLATINNSVKELATRAKDNKLKPDELASGTFTISNLGMFGIKNFAAVINPPQACILAVGSTEKRVVVNENSKDTASQFTVANYMSVTLSCDHRVVDGAIGAQWLAAFREYIEDPTKMLL